MYILPIERMKEKQPNFKSPQRRSGGENAASSHATQDPHFTVNIICINLKLFFRIEREGFYWID